MNTEGPVTKEMLKKFREEFAKAVKPLQDKYGIAIALGTIKYNSEGFQGKLTAATVKTEHKGLSSAEIVYRKNGEKSLNENGYRFGIAGAYGRVININGKNYALIGMNTRSRKSPLILLDILRNKMVKGAPAYIDLIRSSRLVLNFGNNKIEDMK